MSEFAFKINEKFAKEYDEKKKHEELTLLKEKYSDAHQIDELKLLRAAARQKRSGKIGSSVVDFLSDSDYSSSSSEEEDELGELATPQIDIQIFKTMMAINNKDEKLYDRSSTFFAEKDIAEAEKKWKEKQKQTKAQKPVTIKDYQRQVLLEHGGIIDEDKELPKQPKILTHAEEQQQLKDSFKVELSDDGEEDSDADGSGVFVKRDKSKEEVERDEDEYKAFLLENLAKGNDVEQSIEELNFFKESKTDPKNAFLLDYILNRKWMDKPGKPKKIDQADGFINDQVDEINDYLAETYESQYSFRFQEPGGNEIKTYSRNIEDSVRKEDNSRKKKRKEKQARKELEKQQKVEELKRLKNLKMDEIMSKLQKIKDITGNNSVGFDDIDLEGDYDPDTYDKQMSTLFNDQYYKTEDNKKPVWDDDLDISDIVEDSSYTNQKSKKSKKNKKNAGNEEEEFIMDADYLPENQYYQDSNENVGDIDPDIDIESEKKELSKTMDQYYQLNYEDVIGDLPTRFKYQKSKPIDFGLTPEEILLADEKDLNDLVSVKKLAPFRPDWKTSKDLKKVNKNSVLKPLKKKITKKMKLWTETFKEEVKSESSKKKKRKH